MKDFFKNIQRNTILTFAGFVLLGILLIIFPDIIANVAGYIIGAVLIGFGVTKIISYFRPDGVRTGVFGMVIGIISSLVGIYIISRPDVVANFFVSVFGVIILINGAVKTRNAMNLKRAGISNWWSALIPGVISLLLGIIFVISPDIAHDIMMRLLGGVLIFEGISDLWTILAFSAQRKKNEKRKNEIEGEYTIIDSEDVD
ncbi:MAG: hypothetical protein E7536_04745 [Ruminococcaceae bacterium]|nr:hypothetical protein [Oscillospiraceae bacterium]